MRRSSRSIQIIIYAGAIMVLFLFVVMLLNAPHEEPSPAKACEPLRAVAMRFGALLAVAFAARTGVGADAEPGESRCVAGAAVAELGRPRSGEALFTDYAFAFEVTSVSFSSRWWAPSCCAPREARLECAMMPAQPLPVCAVGACSSRSARPASSSAAT